jgi:hypothetical protein
VIVSDLELAVAKVKDDLSLAVLPYQGWLNALNALDDKADPRCHTANMAAALVAVEKVIDKVICEPF